jgi:hypothetical protein
MERILMKRSAKPSAASILDRVAAIIDRALVQDGIAALRADGWIQAPVAEVISFVVVEAKDRAGVYEAGVVLSGHDHDRIRQIASDAVYAEYRRQLAGEEV